MVQNNPLRRRLIVVSGEGGAGRTTICAALALCAARNGKRALVVEFQREQRIPGIFGIRGSGGQEVEIAENIFATNLDPNLILEEFLLAHIKAPIANLILKSATYKYFVAAAPGLKELLALGQVMRLEQRRTGNTRRFDYGTIIVDGPPEDQGAMFLQVPRAFLHATRRSTVRQEVQKVQRLLTDRKRASFLIVTLPEGSAIDSAINLYNRVNEQNIHTSCLTVNRVFPRLLTRNERSQYNQLKHSLRENDALSDDRGVLRDVLRCAEVTMQRRKTQEHHLDKLRRSTRKPVLEVPLLFSEQSDLERAKAISDHMCNEFEPVRTRV